MTIQTKPKDKISQVRRK